MASIKKNSGFEIKNLISSPLDKVEVLLGVEICEACAETFFICSSEHTIYEKEHKDLISEDLLKFYKDNIVLN